MVRLPADGHANALRPSEWNALTVARAEAYLRAHLDERVRVTELCRLLGLNERGLRRAFHRVHGLSPTRWMRRERLQGVRNALVDPSGTLVTVTSAATTYGFYELGRFAGLYRDAFGERPSDTLRVSRDFVMTGKGRSDACKRTRDDSTELSRQGREHTWDRGGFAARTHRAES